MSDLSAGPRLAPPGWGSDPLTEFLENAYRNRHGTYFHKRVWVDRLSKLDGCFLRVATDWLNPKDQLAALLFLRSHAAFRAACEHAMAGQVAETFPVLRACLEQAGYALHVHRNPGHDELWLRRHDSPESLSKVKDAFTARKVQDSVKAANRHAGERYQALYQITIDYGAHPNERGLTANMSIRKEEDRHLFEQTYLHGDSLSLDFALRTDAQVGMCSLEVLREVFSARFELLGVSAEMLQLRKGL